MLRKLRNLRSWWNFPRRHGISSDALVVDVGCGHMPSMRANILADKFLIDDAERQQPLAIDERPFIVCDALHLPFHDNSIDYIICSHLAEHVDEPEALFAELSRVARAGYVECPGRVREILHGWEFHRWYVEVRGDQLVFEEKPRKLHDVELHEWFSRQFENDRDFEAFFVDHMERLGLVTAYDWVGHIKCVIRRLPGSSWERTSASLEQNGPLTKKEFASQLKRAPRRTLSRNEGLKSRMAKIARRQSDRRARARLRSILCCPKCKDDLTDASEGLFCRDCNANFPVVGNVYYLIPEQIADWRPRLSMDVVPVH
ncbi:MAG TPA: methyltransferase domain-containing protein [Pyrinomonadaceae bacterium]|nr:methyltransferase domain-containing protein [Pyrinomonadaceae bacterium]